MPKIFYIQCKEPAKSWRFDGSNIVDITQLELALWKFAKEHNRYWSIFVNGFELPFEYEPDLTTIFDELPQVLEDLLREDEEPAVLDFFEQGTNLILSLRRDGENILVEFQKLPPLTGKRFEHLPETPQAILASDFYSAWFEFLDELLETLVQQEPSLAHDESYLYYAHKINRIKRKARSKMQGMFLRKASLESYRCLE